MRFLYGPLLVLIVALACKKSNSGVGSPPNQPVDNSSDTLRLLSSSYTPGNSNKGAQDTFNLVFNHKVTVNYFLLNNDGCLPDFKFNTTDSGRTVKFYNFLCGGLGGDYTFQYSVTDSVGAKHTGLVSFQCYTRKINITGTISHYFITRDNNYIWAVTRSPNQLVCIGITDTSYRKSYDLSFLPSKSVYNPDNDKIYIIPGIDDYQHRDSLYVADPSNGAIVKTILIPRGTDDNREHFAEDLAFGANGYGMVSFVDDNYSPGWLVIDSRLGDTLYKHPGIAGGATGLYAFTMCYPNYNGSKVMGLELGGSCRLIVLDCNTHELSELQWPLSPHCYSSYFVANKIQNDLFMVNLQTTGDGQFFVSNDVVTGVTTSFDAYGGSEADFNYRSGQTGYVYYFDNHVFGVVDYIHGNIIMTCDFASNLDKINATTDGKYVISRGPNGLVLFGTGLFQQ